MALTHLWIFVRRFSTGHVSILRRVMPNYSSGGACLVGGSRFLVAMSLSRECASRATEQKDEKPCFAIEFPSVQQPIVGLNTRHLLETFLSRELCVPDVKHLSIEKCWFWFRDAKLLNSSNNKAGDSMAVSAARPPPWIMFRLQQPNDARLLLDLYNAKRSSLAQRGIFVRFMNFPLDISNLHKTASEMLPSLEKSDRTLHFHNMGVSEGDHSFSTRKDLFIHLLPHYLLIYNLSIMPGRPQHGLWMSSYPLMRILCSKLGLIDPLRAFSGPCYAFIRSPTAEHPQELTNVLFGDERDKGIVVEAFREFIQKDSYDGSLRISDPSLSNEVRRTHYLTCDFIPAFRKVGLQAQLTDSGVCIDGNKFTNKDELINHFHRYGIYIHGMPEATPDPRASAAHRKTQTQIDRKLIDQLIGYGLRLPKNEPPVFIYHIRVQHNSSLHEPRMIFIIFPTQEEKDKMLKAYSARRWWLWDRKIYLTDPTVPFKVGEIHQQAMGYLSSPKFDDERRSMLRSVCVFDPSGVVLDGCLCKSTEDIRRHLSKVNLAMVQRTDNG